MEALFCRKQNIWPVYIVLSHIVSHLCMYLLSYRCPKLDQPGFFVTDTENFLKYIKADKLRFSKFFSKDIKARPTCRWMSVQRALDQPGQPEGIASLSVPPGWVPAIILLGLIISSLIIRGPYTIYMSPSDNLIILCGPDDLIILSSFWTHGAPHQPS